MNDVNWRLGNGEQMNAEHPDTFEIPEEWLRKDLQPGFFAKLVFLAEEPENQGFSGERMWVEVKYELSDDGTYLGTLANRPFGIEGLEHGDLVMFRPEHVIDVHIPDDWKPDEDVLV